MLYMRTPEFIAGAVLLFILLYFLLVYDGVFISKVIKLMPTLSDKKTAVSIAHDIESHVSRYLLIILISLTFWGWMWGIVGVILAVPILAALKIFCAHIERMAPIAEFLS